MVLLSHQMGEPLQNVDKLNTWRLFSVEYHYVISSQLPLT